MKKTNLEFLTSIILKFRSVRNWKQFHNPKDMAISLSLEASEVLEHFQWKSEEEVKKYIKSHKDHIGEELMDVLWWILLMCHDFKIDINDSFIKKLQKNNLKYPVEKSKNSHKKWSELK